MGNHETISKILLSHQLICRLVGVHRNKGTTKKPTDSTIFLVTASLRSICKDEVI